MAPKFRQRLGAFAPPLYRGRKFILECNEIQCRVILALIGSWDATVVMRRRPSHPSPVAEEYSMQLDRRKE